MHTRAYDEVCFLKKSIAQAGRPTANIEDACTRMHTYSYTYRCRVLSACIAASAMYNMHANTFEDIHTLNTWV